MKRTKADAAYAALTKALEELCRDYGNVARPPAGVWGGCIYPKRQRAR